MVRDYFADINADQAEPSQGRSNSQEQDTTPARPRPQAAQPVSGERSIRNIPVSVRRPPTSMSGMRASAVDIRAEGMIRPQGTNSSGEKRSISRLLIWVVAGAFFLALMAVGYFVLFGKTSVTVTPRSHVITFDTSTHFTAYPAATAAAGTLSYTIQTTQYEDSAVVPANGTEHAEDKATGNIVVFNNYSTSPLRFIKNTRFQSPDGHVFRIPATVEVPGKQGATPGQIGVTVFADQPGPDYNIAPVPHFTLPGLKGSAEFDQVYAASTETFSGGFSGTRPAVASSTLASARASLRAKLQQKAQAASLDSTGNFVFPALMNSVYESMPLTTEPGGAVSIHEKATVSIPVFDAANFSSVISQAVVADAARASVKLIPDEGFQQQIFGAYPPDSSKDPITFTLSGTATLVWQVDSAALASALAGKSQGAFNTVVGSFSGIEKAQARITPFWKQSFPIKPTDIIVSVGNPLQKK